MTTQTAEKAKEARRKILTMVHRAGTSHIASNFSVIDIAVVLYDNLKQGDEVVWSKGWAAATIYYFLAQQKKIPVEDLDKFPNPPYLGLAETEVNGVLVSGGSMGHGLPIAVGMALGKKLAGEEGTIYCIMSDGEMNEGTTWESAMLAAHHKLGNLVVLVDVNKWQAMGKTEDVLSLNEKPYDLQYKFKTFGWSSWELDGHNHNVLHDALTLNFLDFMTLTYPNMTFQFTKKERKNLEEMPKIFLANTIKGKGVSFMENHLTYHYKNVNDEEYQRALTELQ